jgi:hypothetical protein
VSKERLRATVNRGTLGGGGGSVEIMKCLCAYTPTHTHTVCERMECHGCDLGLFFESGGGFLESRGRETGGGGEGRERIY